MSTRAPETMGQARRWEAVQARALAAGLCDRCASQFAWGSAGGFASVHPPCSSCRSIVAAWPVPKPSGWRAPVGPLSAVSTWADAAYAAPLALPGIYGAGSAPAHIRSSHTVSRLIQAGA